MYERIDSISVDELLEHAAGLSTAHTPLVFDDSDLFENLTPQDIVDIPDELTDKSTRVVTFDMGHYKEGDDEGNIAITSILRTIYFRASDGPDGAPRTDLAIARLRRIAVADRKGGNRVAVDLLHVTDEGEGVHEITHYPELPVEVAKEDFLDAEFWITQRAIFQMPLEVEKRLGQAGDVSPTTFRTSISGESVGLAVTNNSTKQFLGALFGLDLDDRYVNRFASEKEAALSRESTIELIGALDALHEELEAGNVIADNEETLNDDGTVASQTWTMLSPDGLVVSLTKVPRDAVTESNDEADKLISDGVVPPPTELLSSDGTKDYSYSINIHDPLKGNRRALYVSGSQLMVQYNEFLPEEYEADIEDLKTASEITFIVNWSNLMEGRVYLAPKDIENLIKFIDGI